VIDVSILARSGDRALPFVRYRYIRYHNVSILARSGDRALPLAICQSKPLSVFQSSPGLVTGRYLRQSQLGLCCLCFNPRPVW